MSASCSEQGESSGVNTQNQKLEGLLGPRQPITWEDLPPFFTMMEEIKKTWDCLVTAGGKSLGRLPMSFVHLWSKRWKS